MQKDLRNTIIAIVLSLIASLVAGYLDYDTYNDLQAKISENEQLEQDIKTLTETKGQDKLNELTAQLKLLNDNFASYVKILPSAEVATDERLRKTVQAWCTAAQLDWESVDVAKKTGGAAGAKIGEFQETTVNLRATGSFETFVRFLNQLEKHEQFFRLNSYSLTPKGKPKFLDGKQQIDLGMSIVVSTFTYVPQK